MHLIVRFSIPQFFANHLLLSSMSIPKPKCRLIHNILHMTHCPPIFEIIRPTLLEIWQHGNPSRYELVCQIANISEVEQRASWLHTVILTKILKPPSDLILSIILSIFSYTLSLKSVNLMNKMFFSFLVILW